MGNWQACPTADQLDGYTHLVVAFAVSYTWAASKNNCDSTCGTGPGADLTYDGVCVGATGNEIAQWKAAGKKVILSFGGAGMGGSWASDNNDCWDHCFGNEEALSNKLINLVSTHGYDGIDIDYEYCYDTASGRHGRNCNNSGTGKYSDAAAQNFLNQMTIKLRTKLDALGDGYELTHAPMDSDLDQISPYYQILKSHSDKLNFLMPQFYNGYTRAHQDGFTGTGQGSIAASTVYYNLVNDMFNYKAEKVVFGFCISDCSQSGSNANGSQAATVMNEIVAEGYTCNGGAFFWVALHDTGGTWSDAVYPVATANAGCSVTSSGTDPPTKSPSKAPTNAPTDNPTHAPTSEFPGTCSDGTGACSETNLSQCQCAARRKLRVLPSKGAEESKALRGRKLGKPAPKEPKTPSPTAAPITPSPTALPTAPPTNVPTAFECKCNLPAPQTPAPTSPPTAASTPNPTNPPTPSQPTGNCTCGDYDNKSACNGACGGNQCSYQAGKNGGCFPV
jgi:chitinase